MKSTTNDKNEDDAKLNQGNNTTDSKKLLTTGSPAGSNANGRVTSSATFNRKATFATKLFDSKNSFVPLTALLLLKLSNELAPEEIFPVSISIYYT